MSVLVPREDRFVKLRADYLDACDGNLYAALILDRFRYWTQVRADDDDQAASGGKPPRGL